MLELMHSRNMVEVPYKVRRFRRMGAGPLAVINQLLHPLTCYVTDVEVQVFNRLNLRDVRSMRLLDLRRPFEYVRIKTHTADVGELPRCSGALLQSLGLRLRLLRPFILSILNFFNSTGPNDNTGRSPCPPAIVLVDVNVSTEPRCHTWLTLDHTTYLVTT